MDPVCTLIEGSNNGYLRLRLFETSCGPLGNRCAKGFSIRRYFGYRHENFYRDTTMSYYGSIGGEPH